MKQFVPKIMYAVTALLTAAALAGCSPSRKDGRLMTLENCVATGEAVLTAQDATKPPFGKSVKVFYFTCDTGGRTQNLEAVTAPTQSGQGYDGDTVDNGKKYKIRVSVRPSSAGAFLGDEVDDKGNPLGGIYGTSVYLLRAEYAH